MFRVRVEGARLGLWKRVIGSRVLLWGWLVKVELEGGDESGYVRSETF
jgi:hypothetical protein